MYINKNFTNIVAKIKLKDLISLTLKAEGLVASALPTS